MTFFMALVKVLISIIFLLLLSRDPARSQNNFFSGKTVRIVIGSSPGGGYDYWDACWPAICPSTYPAILKWSCRTCRAADRW